MNIEIRAEIRYYTDKFSWLCFRHATTLAVAGHDILTEIGNFDGEHYMGPTWCLVCADTPIPRHDPPPIGHSTGKLP